MKKNENIEVLDETLESEKVKEKECCGGECHCKKRDSVFTKIISYIFVGVLLFVIGLGLGGFLTLKENQDDLTNDKDITYNEGAYKEIVNNIEDLAKIEHLSRDINKVSELNNQELLQFALNYVEINKDEDTFSLDDVNKVVKSYFGRTVNGEDIKCLALDNAEVVYFFDKETNTFRRNEEHSGHGGSDGTPYVLNRIVDFTYDGSKYVVKVKKAFSIVPDTGFAENYYRTYEDLKNSKNLLFQVDIVEGIDGGFYASPLQSFENIDDDELVTYEYTFEYTDNEFVLVSYVIGE